MVNEILPPDKIYDRAWEIARKLMTKKRAMRRTTVQILRAPWKEALAKELRFAFGMEMMVTATDKPEHTNEAWNDLTDKQRKNMAKNAQKMAKKHSK